MRGDIYRLKASRTARGHGQQGQRFGVILQADYLPLSTILVAPTSTKCSPASFRPELQIDGVTTRIMVEQTAAIDVESRLGEMVGRLSHTELEAVDRALELVFDLSMGLNGM